MDTRASNHARSLYPHLSPRDSGWLAVGDGHEIYWEVCGNPDGKPALFLHGGPGGSCQPDHRRLFDPQTYRIVLFDQRGSGRSRPKGELNENATPKLLQDIETLRQFLNVEDWLVLGGSWGAALALAYAQAHPARVRALVLRGVFTGRQCEVDWLYKFGASSIFPESWQRFLAPIPEGERDDIVAAYHRRLTHDDINIRREAARTWCAWESELLTLMPRPSRSSSASEGDMALARIEAHYFIHQSFLAQTCRVSGIFPELLCRDVMMRLRRRAPPLSFRKSGMRVCSTSSPMRAMRPVSQAYWQGLLRRRINCATDKSEFQTAVREFKSLLRRYFQSVDNLFPGGNIRFQELIGLANCMGTE
jgi:proline iminopeptidase